MVADLFFAIPGDTESRTGGYLYDKRLVEALRRQGQAVGLLNWPGSFPFPTVTDETVVAGSLAACPDGALVMIDGLAFGAMPELAWAERDRLRLVALVHHPLALETGLSASAAAAFARSERLALAAARLVITTSGTTAGILAADYGVDSTRLVVAQPGVDVVDPKASSPMPGSPIRLLSLGTVTPRKGHDVLVEALARIADLDWHCTIAGSLRRTPETAAALRRQIAACGLETRIALAGEVEDPEPYYREADIFVLPSRFEGYGMVFAEALAHGLPVVGTQAGAVPEVVPESAGILVPVDDAGALADALRSLVADPALRQIYAEGARATAARLRSWSHTARLVASALDQVQL